MEEDSENESEPQTLQIKPHYMPLPIRPSKTPSYVSQSSSEMYQPPPHTWETQATAVVSVGLSHQRIHGAI